MPRETRDEQKRRETAVIEARYSTERRMQVAALLVLAAAVLVGTVLYVGPHDVFLPGWWRFW